MAWQLDPAHVKMAQRIARAFIRKVPPNVQRCDVEQAALIGLFDGVRRHPDGEGPGFEAYLRARIRGSILDELRTSGMGGRRQRAGATFRPVVVGFDDVAPNWQDLFAGAGDDAETLTIRELDAAKAWATPLQERDWRIMRARFRRDVKQDLVGEAEHISAPRVSQRERIALAQMRAHLEDP